MTRRRALLGAKQEDEYWDYEWMTPDYMLDADARVGLFACKKIPVEAGDIITIEFWYSYDPMMGKYHGYVYDGRAVGIQYLGDVGGTAHPIPAADRDKSSTVIISPVINGLLTVCAYNTMADGAIDFQGNNMCGKYLRVHIEK